MSGNSAVPFSNPKIELPDDCPICHDTLIDPGRALYKPRQCHHFFHYNCIRGWVKDYHKKTCPVCRRLDVNSGVLSGSQSDPVIDPTPQFSNGRTQDYTFHVPVLSPKDNLTNIFNRMVKRREYTRVRLGSFDAYEDITERRIASLFASLFGVPQDTISNLTVADTYITALTEQAAINGLATESQHRLFPEEKVTLADLDSGMESDRKAKIEEIYYILKVANRERERHIHRYIVDTAVGKIIEISNILSTFDVDEYESPQYVGIAPRHALSNTFEQKILDIIALERDVRLIASRTRRGSQRADETLLERQRQRRH